jgi:predicted ATPase/DNA-binding XRE family transcriptional regulator
MEPGGSKIGFSMKRGAGPFGAHLKGLREAAGFTQEELAAIAGLSVHAVSALERGERRRPQLETLRALSAALDLAGAGHDAFFARAREPVRPAAEELSETVLPMPLTPLLGRDVELQVVRGWLGQGDLRLITLIGPGGVGKTRLALEIAGAAAADETARVVFVPLAAVGNAALAPAAIAEGFGFSDTTVADLPRRARVACQNRATLLVLDNFEHVLQAAPLVGDLLVSVPLLQVLVTSRAPLRIRGEREYVVGPLALDAGAETLPPEEMARLPAVRLFVERARDVLPEFELTSANGQTVIAICRRLDALPLALELAAPWIKTLNADGLWRRLERDVLLSAIAPRDLPERQRTMNATVAWSYQLLDAEERRAFRRLGALPGLFPIDAAAELLAGREPASGTERALAAVAILIDKSLLSRAETSAMPTCPLYYMLETVRAYAALELVASGERDDTLEGLVRYCSAEASLAAEGLIGPDQANWLDRAREDLESYRAALGWLIESGRSGEAARIGWSLLFFWVIRGHGAEGLRWYHAILQLPGLTPAVRSRALAGAAVMSYTQGELEPARSAMTEALALAEPAGQLDIVAEARNLLGHLEHAAGNNDAALRWFSQSVEMFEAMDIPWGVGNGLSGMAWVALTRGDIDGAGRLLDEAVPWLARAGPWFSELGLYIRAVMAVRCGNASEAIRFVRESLTRILELQDKFAFVYALVPLAAAAVLKGDDEWAARSLGARDAITERTGAALLDPSVTDLRDQAERGARARLGPARWARAYEAGRSSTINGLLEQIDAALLP